jgi:ABC-type Na+ efflux pump permease subunit
MRTTWTLVRKELVLLSRDRKAAILLVAMPFLFILVLGLLLGETFGQKTDDRTRVMIVDLDDGPEMSPGKTWAQVVLDDMKDTAGIRIETVSSEEEARRLVDDHKQAAVLVFEPGFSTQIKECSFLKDGINPFYRDGVDLEKIHATLIEDKDKQPYQAAIIKEVVQTSMLRVLLPYMIGKAFRKLGEPEFIDLLSKQVRLPVPDSFALPLRLLKAKTEKDEKTGREMVALDELLRVAAADKEHEKADTNKKDYQQRVGDGVQAALNKQFENYELTGMTWDKLTRAKGDRAGAGGEIKSHVDADGTGLLHRGALRYQLLVPGFTVMFAFFLILIVGWVFVAERRQGTLKRLAAAPVSRAQILVGKFLPCFAISLAQCSFLLVAGKVIFGMRWGPDSWPVWQQILWLAPIVFCTSLAAVGMALLIASLARSEMHVTLVGAIVVLALAFVGGCILPRDMMPEGTETVTRLTPHGWALDAYQEMFRANPKSPPKGAVVATSCGVLAAFGVGFLGLSWWRLKLD